MIRLGSLAGYSFEGPYTLGGWTPIDRPGVYAIMYKQDEGKDNYAVVYVGHTDNFAEEGLPWKHPQAHCWTERAGSQWKLYIAYFLIPAQGGTRSIRAGIATELNAIYQPICNEDQYVQHWEEEWIGDYESNLTKKLMLSKDADVHKQSSDPAGRREPGR